MNVFDSLTTLLTCTLVGDFDPSTLSASDIILYDADIGIIDHVRNLSNTFIAFPAFLVLDPVNYLKKLQNIEYWLTQCPPTLCRVSGSYTLRNHICTMWLNTATVFINGNKHEKQSSNLVLNDSVVCTPSVFSDPVGQLHWKHTGEDIPAGIPVIGSMGFYDQNKTMRIFFNSMYCSRRWFAVYSRVMPRLIGLDLNYEEQNIPIPVETIPPRILAILDDLETNY